MAALITREEALILGETEDQMTPEEENASYATGCHTRSPARTSAIR